MLTLRNIFWTVVCTALLFGAFQAVRLAEDRALPPQCATMIEEG